MKSIDRQIIADTARQLVHNNRIKRQTGMYPLANLFLFVTMRCNAKCDHCFCWQDLNVGIPEMSLEQLARVAETVPPFNEIVMTGGEPMLRKDLLDICREFAKRHKPKVIHINTNALFPERIEQLAHAFKREFPEVGLDFQLSLDGLAETHDRIRGVPGNFNKVIETFQRIWPLTEQYPAMAVRALTIITDLNYKELLALNDYLREHVHPDVNQGFEIVRDVEKTAWNILPEIKESGVGPKNMDLPPVEAFDQIIRDIETVNMRAPMHANAYRLHTAATLRMIATGKEQYKCRVAGSAVGVIYSNGDVTACEFTKPFANLADFDYDFNALWTSDAAWARRKQITCCHCTHGSFHGKAVEYSWRGVAGMVAQSLP